MSDNGPWFSGGHAFGRCGYCEKIVRLTGFFGSLHICLTPEEREQKRMIEAQKKATPPADGGA